MYPKLFFTIYFDTTFKVTCYSCSKQTSIQHMLDFPANMKTYAQLNDIIKCMKKQPPDLSNYSYVATFHYVLLIYQH